MKASKYILHETLGSFQKNLYIKKLLHHISSARIIQNSAFRNQRSLEAANILDY